MRTKAVIVFFLFLFHTFQSLPQTNVSKKHEIVYKTVNGHQIRANIFLPKSDKLHPVLVFFHGGFFFGNRDVGLYSNLKEKLLNSGYAVVSADYRLAPETKLSGILDDVRDIIFWLKTKGTRLFNIDSKRIAACGCSAGGYMALTTGFTSACAPKLIIAISAPTGFSSENIEMGDLSVLKMPGPYNIVTDSVVSYGNYDTRLELWRFLAKNKLALYELFGFDPAKEPEKLDQFRLTNNIGSDYPSTLIIHAKNDPLVDLQQVKDFSEFLNKKKINNELYVVENGHSNELLDQNPDAISKIIDYLNDHFKE